MKICKITRFASYVFRFMGYSCLISAVGYDHWWAQVLQASLGVWLIDVGYGLSIFSDFN